MFRFGRFGRHTSVSRADDELSQSTPDARAPGPSVDQPAASLEQGTDDPTLAPLPEQPVPLPPVAGGRAKVGVLVPLRRSRSLMPSLLLPTPRIPKRAILAVGIAAGLAAPSVTRQLAGRALMATLGGGRAARGGSWEAATVEVIRVTYGGPQRGPAAEVLGKLVEQLRR